MARRKMVLKDNILITEERARDGAEVCSTELLEQLKEENQKLRIAIQSAIDCANGRESEWGDRAESAFYFLYDAIDTYGTTNVTDDLRETERTKDD